MCMYAPVSTTTVAVLYVYTCMYVHVYISFTGIIHVHV